MDVCWIEFLFPQWWCHLSTAEPLQDTSHRWSTSHAAFNLLKADSSLKWTLFMVPRVSAYGRLDCRCNNLLYTYWDLRRVNFRSQTDVNQSNVAYRFSHMWEKWHVQSGAAYHGFSCVSRTASWSFHSRLVGAVSYTAQAIALRVWRGQIVFIRISSIVNIESSCLGETETERRWQRIRIEESDSD